MLEKSSNVSLLKLQVVAIKLRDSHLLDGIVGQRHVKSCRAKPNPNSGEMVSRMLAYCRCVHVHEQCQTSHALQCVLESHLNNMCHTAALIVFIAPWDRHP